MKHISLICHGYEISCLIWYNNYASDAMHISNSSLIFPKVVTQKTEVVIIVAAVMHAQKGMKMQKSAPYLTR